MVAIAGAFLAVAFAAIWAGWISVFEPDIWWSLAAGRYIVEHRTIPATDVLSYTYEGANWLNGEWLSQVLYYALYQLGGGTLLVLYKFALVVGVFAALAWVCWKRSGSLVLACITTVLAAHCCRGFFDIRAQLFLFVGTVGVIGILDSYRRGASERVLWLLTPLMVLWVNLHFSFLFGIGVLLFYALAEAVKSRFGLPSEPLPWPRVRTLWIAIAIAVLATAINPYHVRSWIEPFVIIGDESEWRDEIAEWLRTRLFFGGDLNPILFTYLLIAQLVSIVVALVCDRRRLDLTDLGLVAVTAFMGLSARRFIPLFAVVAAPALASHLASVVSVLPASWVTQGELSTRFRALAIATVAVGATIAQAVAFAPEFRESVEPGLFRGLTRAEMLPEGAAQFLKLNPIPGRMYHPYLWAGYLNLMDESRKVFIDGRAHTVYPWSFYTDYQEVEFGRARWSDILDRWGVSLIVWPSGSFANGQYANSIKRFEQSNQWVRVYNDGRLAVFAHVERGRPWIDSYRRATLKYPDLPGAQLFAAQMLISAKQFERALETLQQTRIASPEAMEATNGAETGYRALVQSQDSGDNWFGLGFYSEANGNTDSAVQSYEEALSRQLGPSERAYATKALQRLKPHA